MKIWIDLDNAPHVPFFRPIIPELETRGHEVIVTARDFHGTLELCHMWDILHEAIGKHGGRNKLRKVGNLLHRAQQLIRYISPKKPDLAISHGSRTQIVAAKAMWVPSLVGMDYEHTEGFFFKRWTKQILMPEAIPNERLLACGFPLHKVRRYAGFKEELYLPFFTPDPTFRSSLHIAEDEILVTIRPSAMMANYHNPLSEYIVLELIERALNTPKTAPLIVSRTIADQTLIKNRFGNNVRFLDKAVDGLQLIWHSDVFISGGGTMNREGALMGVPVYSIFTGPKPYLDEYLAEQGKLVFVDTKEKVDLVRFAKRNIPEAGPTIRQGLAGELADMIVAAATE